MVHDYRLYHPRRLSASRHGRGPSRMSGPRPRKTSKHDFQAQDPTAAGGKTTTVGPVPTKVPKPGTTSGTTGTTAAPGTTVGFSHRLGTAPDAPEGDGEGVISIPSVGVNFYYVEARRATTSKKGPGHYPTTPLPGTIGNAAIAWPSHHIPAPVRGSRQGQDRRRHHHHDARGDDLRLPDVPSR